MKLSSFSKLTQAAESKMEKSRDPIHAHGHAYRVVQFVKKLASSSCVKENDIQALTIAAWWHDVSRTLTKNPSFVLMPLIDDLLSGFMLLWYILRNGLYEKEAFLAVRLILGKSLGTGAFLKTFLLSKHNQLLADLLKDADTLDTFAIERMEQAMVLVDSYRRYAIGYKIVCRWFSLINHIKMKTEAARSYVLQLLRNFITWLKSPDIITWHIEHFGKRWTRRSLKRIELVANNLSRNFALTSI